MKITLDYRNPTPSHCDVAVYANGALTGVLTMRQEELVTFQHIVLHGLDRQRDEFLGTGDPGPLIERARLWEQGHQAGREKAPTYAENQQLRDRVDQLETLLQDLKNARPLLLYGDAWLRRIDEVLSS